MDLPSTNNAHLRNTKKTNKMKKKQVKVVYISTPLKVKTCASKFRALVQELTGKDSDIYELAEIKNGNYLECSDVSPPQSSSKSPTSSDSLLDPQFGDIMDDIFVAGTYSLEESPFFGTNFKQELPFDTCEHLLGSYGLMSNF